MPSLFFPPHYLEDAARCRPQAGAAALLLVCCSRVGLQQLLLAMVESTGRGRGELGERVGGGGGGGVDLVGYLATCVRMCVYIVYI